MISWYQEVRHTTLQCEPVDQRHEAHVPLYRVSSVLNGIARLENELDWMLCRSQFLDLCQHGINDERMLVLKCLAVSASSSISVDNERELRHTTGRGLIR